MQGKLLTPQQKATFLQRLKSTNGNATKAAKSIKISRSTAYKHKESDADFSAEWDEIIEALTLEAEQELFRRAVKGVNSPVFYKGKKIATVREFSDRLLEFFLKSKRPDVYRERLDINNNISGSLDVNIEAEIDNVYGDGDGKADDTDFDELKDDDESQSS